MIALFLRCCVGVVSNRPVASAVPPLVFATSTTTASAASTVSAAAASCSASSVPPPLPPPPVPLRDQILAAALSHVAQHGWTQTALNHAVAQLGLSPAAVGLVTRGPAELVEYFIESCNRQLVADLAQASFTEYTPIFTHLRHADPCVSLTCSVLSYPALCRLQDTGNHQESARRSQTSFRVAEPVLGHMAPSHGLGSTASEPTYHVT
jgi:hypothetical protein